MRSGAYGIQEPAAGDELPPDVVLAPTLGFTPFGDRVGYGGGYDRTLAALRDGGQPFTAIGIAWSCGELDADYEPAEHDYPLDAILTEDGWVPEAPLSQPGKGGKTVFLSARLSLAPPARAAHHFRPHPCTKTVRSVTSTVGRPAERGPAPP